MRACVGMCVLLVCAFVCASCVFLCVLNIYVEFTTDKDFSCSIKNFHGSLKIVLVRIKLMLNF